MTEPDATAWALRPGSDARARTWLVQGGPVGPTPRPAASICLLRDAPGGVQVLWITRGHRLAVAPGALAFPGGAVEDCDGVRRPGGAGGPGPPGRFDVLARAAARELAEETGHLVPPRAMAPLVRWVTPEHEPRRFDTTFLVAVLPPGGDPEPVPPGEVHEHGWAGPGHLLADVAACRRTALPPTRAVLARLARAVEAVRTEGGGPDGAMAVMALLRCEAVLVPVLPRAAWRTDGADSGSSTAGSITDSAARGVDLLLPRHAGEVP